MWDRLHALSIVAIAFGALYTLVDMAQRFCDRQHRKQGSIRDERRRRGVDRRQRAHECAGRAAEASEPSKRERFERRAVNWDGWATRWDRLAGEANRRLRWWDFLR